MSDLDEAIELDRAVLALCPPGHSGRSMSLNNLAIHLQDRFMHKGVLHDLDEAFSLYAQLSQISHAVLHSDLLAVKSWTISAEQLKHGTALSAYQTALRVLDDWQHLAGLSFSSHYFDVVSKATSSLAMDTSGFSIFKTALNVVRNAKVILDI